MSYREAFPELNQRIVLAEARVRRAAVIDRRIPIVDEEAESLAARVAALDAVVEREARDVSNIESGGVSAWLATALRDGDAKLAREREELVRAQLEREEAAAELEGARAWIGALRRERAELGDPQEALLELFAQKERALTRLGGDAARRLDGMQRRVAALHWTVQQLAEALTAGKVALGVLAQLRDAFGSAQRGAIAEVVEGDIGRTLRHNAAVDARRRLPAAQTALRRFAAELADLREVPEGLSGLAPIDLGLATRFLDGLIIAWVQCAGADVAKRGVVDTLQDVSDRLKVVAAAGRHATSALATAQQEYREILRAPI